MDSETGSLMTSHGRNVGYTAGLDDALEWHVRDHIDGGGCSEVGHVLGFVKMPRGYALMLNGDESHFYGLKYDGSETGIHWNKWAIYRWARDDEKAFNTSAQRHPGCKANSDA